MKETALVLSSIYDRLLRIQQALEEVGWEVVAFQDPREALERLRSGTRVQAIFCDELLRGASAAGFLAWSGRLAQRKPFYLIAGGDEKRSAGKGVAGVLAFPLSRAALPRPGREAKAPNGPEPGPPQDLRALLTSSTATLPFADLLQMMGVSRSSAVIAFDHGRLGSIHVREGQLEHVESRHGEQPLTGLRALGELMSVNDSHFVVLPYEVPARVTIGLPAAAAVLDASRQADERKRLEALLRALKASFPAVLASAGGYELAKAPDQGDARLFERVQALLKQQQEILGARVRRLVVVGDRAYGGFLTPQGSLVAASAAPDDAGALLDALEELERAAADPDGSLGQGLAQR